MNIKDYGLTSHCASINNGIHVMKYWKDNERETTFTFKVTSKGVDIGNQAAFDKKAQELMGCLIPNDQKLKLRIAIISFI
jgi:hypothetical protein